MYRCTLICVCQLNIWLNMNHNAYRLWLSYEVITFPFYFHSLFALWSLLFISHHIFISITNQPCIMVSIHIYDVLMIYIHTYMHRLYIVLSSLYPHCWLSLLLFITMTYAAHIHGYSIYKMIRLYGWYIIWMYPYHVICSSPFIYPFWLMINSIDNQ